MSEKSLKVGRDIAAIRIPQGEAITIPQGSEVVITQELGGSFTILVPSMPGLYRVAAEEADALGRETQNSVEPTEGEADESAVWAALKSCYDPEIPVNIVDLGLIYKMDLTRDPQGAAIAVQMTLTAPGCGMGPTIAAEAQSKLLRIPGVISATVDLVWDPPWSPDRISDEGRAKLGIG